MAEIKLPTMSYKDIGEKGARYALDEVEYKGLTIRQWADKITGGEYAPVVHGRWVYNPNGMDWNLGAWQCSVCKCNNNNLPGNDKYNPYIFQGSNYCPNCGAKMDGEV